MATKEEQIPGQIFLTHMGWDYWNTESAAIKSGFIINVSSKRIGFSTKDVVLRHIQHQDTRRFHPKPEYENTW